MEKRILIFVLIILLFLFPSCGMINNDGKDKGGSEFSFLDTVFIDYYNGTELSGGEETGQLVLWTLQTVKNLYIISVGHKEIDGTVVLFEDEILYSIDELTPDEPFVFSSAVAEGIPNLGVTYTDEDEVKRYFYVSWNGLDGSIGLREFYLSNKGD